ncbi:MAG TPA: Crp/Fnr family transcriptional regulator [Terracidiphilus sp.]|nr:Crp/Fnr family transcriptional regulator [Terracidiphilus sp.]
MSEIRRLSIFHTLSDESRRLLDGGSITMRVPERRTLIKKGEQVSGAYFVLNGRLRVFTSLANGREATLYFVKPGETCVLALNSLFNGLLYPAWVEADAPTAAAIIPGRIFRVLFETERAIRDLALGAMATLAFRLMDELDQAHTCTLEQRLVNFLLVRASGKERAVRQTQQQIADHLGTSREVIARVIGRIAARGYIVSGRKVITILKPAMLAKLGT